MAHWLKVEPKQSTLFFNTHISFLILEDKVEHAIETLDGEAILAWQTCDDQSFFKDLFSFETKSSSFEIEAIYFSKIDSLLKQFHV